MSYFVSVACTGTLEKFDSLEKAQQFINDEMEMSGFTADEVDVIKGYYLRKRDIQSVLISDAPDCY